MATQDSFQERTEEPTPKRLHEARERGQVPRSRELSGMAVMIFGASGLLLLAPGMVEQITSLFKQVYALPGARPLDNHLLLNVFSDAAFDTLIALTPFLLLVGSAAIAAPLLIGGWVLSAQQLQFKAEKLNPLKGLKRIFSIRALVELAKALGKFLVVAVFTGILFVALWEPLLALRGSALSVGLRDAGGMIGWSFIVLSAALILIAAIDVPFQIWQYKKQLRMTRQEVRDEMKDTEGKPEVRSRIRQLQQQLAQARMMEEVPHADVVITNPTHVSVALRYDERRMRAPILVAKGMELVAQRIREVAREHDVAIVEAALLARVLHASTELQQPIPAPLYLAVAQVLAFVLQLRMARKRGGKPPKPPQPEVPETFIDALRSANKPV
ncbi:MAG: flagellar biosynthesis protein FlhB [Gammaproteobacteria bacterium]|nr:flagellar biosynthesis protein FlhB [Gammaproteobacteria bacterium]